MYDARVRRATILSLTAALLFIAPLAVSSISSSGAIPALWSEPVMISEGEAMDIVADGDSLYVVGFDMLATSHDVGMTWSSVPGIHSKICADDGVLYRADMGGGYGPGILFSTSTDDGATWSGPMTIIELEGGNDGSYGIFKFGSRLVFYTMDGQPGGNEFGAMVKVTWSDDEGATWSTPVVVDQGLYVEDPFANDIVCANGVLYMTYYDQTPGFDNVEVIVAKSADMGASWTNSVVAVAPHAHNPIITADPTSGKIYVSYFSAVILPDWTLVDAGPFVVRSADGVAWSAPTKAGTIAMGTDQSGFHSLAASGGFVFEGYLDYVSGDVDGTYHVRISCSSDDGATWTDMGDVTGTEGNTVFPILCVASEKLHFIWTDYGSGSPWYDYGDTYHRAMPLSLTLFGDVTVTRQKSGSPAGDSKTMSFTPDKAGKIWVSASGDRLPVLKIEVFEKGAGKPKLVSAELLVFGWMNAGPLESKMVTVDEGHEYLVKLTPYGPLGSSAHVTGLFVAG